MESQNSKPKARAGFKAPPLFEVNTLEMCKAKAIIRSYMILLVL